MPILPQVPPQIMSFDFGDGVSNFEDSTATTCMISKGDQPLLIQWYLNDQSIRNDYFGIQIMQMGPKLSALRIDSLNDKHRGNYTCEVKNKAGIAKFSAELKINGDFWKMNFVTINSLVILISIPNLSPHSPLPYSFSATANNAIQLR